MWHESFAETKIKIAEVIHDVELNLLPRIMAVENAIRSRHEAAARAAERTRELAELNALIPSIRLGAFTDRQMLTALKKALREAAAERKKRGWPANDGVWASDVADVLAGKEQSSGPPHVSRGDVSKVGKCLARLAREGRIVLVSKNYESRRYELPEHARA